MFQDQLKVEMLEPRPPPSLVIPWTPLLHTIIYIYYPDLTH